jgi:hypothetical protein
MIPLLVGSLGLPKKLRGPPPLPVLASRFALIATEKLRAAADLEDVAKCRTGTKLRERKSDIFRKGLG